MNRIIINFIFGEIETFFHLFGIVQNLSEPQEIRRVRPIPNDFDNYFEFGINQNSKKKGTVRLKKLVI